jgi:hypothetical protein
MDSNKKSQPEKLRKMAKVAAQEAFSSFPDKDVLLELSNGLEEWAQAKEQAIKNVPAVAVLPADATEAETRNKRRTQATQVGKHVYLPIWKELMHIMPSWFLRSALFSADSHVQEAWADEAKKPSIVVDKKIATTNDVTLMLSGYELCQFDRRVYGACLAFYRERPLAYDEKDERVETSFYAFALQMGRTYSRNTHRAIRASLLRLSKAQIRLRCKRLNLELPKLLSASFEDGEADDDYKGADRMSLQIPASIAELFGRGAWSAINDEVFRANDLKGWVGCFYASHSKEWEYSLEQLHRMSGYGSRLGNFKAGITHALTKLQESPDPLIASYRFNQGNTKLKVTRVGWKQVTPELPKEI